MPYIKPKRRRIFNRGLEGLMNTNFIEKGDLTYCAYKLGIDYINQKGIKYQHISDAVSALNDAAEEIRRRVMFHYEDRKIKENGDII